MPTTNRESDTYAYKYDARRLAYRMQVANANHDAAEYDRLRAEHERVIAAFQEATDTRKYNFEFVGCRCGGSCHHGYPRSHPHDPEKVYKPYKRSKIVKNEPFDYPEEVTQFD